MLGETFPELVQEHYGDGSRLGVRITYVHQGKPLGIAHAIGLCKEFVEEDSFVVYLGDNLLQKGIKGYLNDFVNGSYDAYILLKEVEDPTRFGVAKFDENGKLVVSWSRSRRPPKQVRLGRRVLL